MQNIEELEQRIIDLRENYEEEKADRLQEKLDFMTTKISYLPKEYIDKNYKATNLYQTITGRGNFVDHDEIRKYKK